MDSFTTERDAECRAYQNTYKKFYNKLEKRQQVVSEEELANLTAKADKHAIPGHKDLYDKIDPFSNVAFLAPTIGLAALMTAEFIAEVPAGSNAFDYITMGGVGIVFGGVAGIFAGSGIGTATEKIAASIVGHRAGKAEAKINAALDYNHSLESADLANDEAEME